MPHVVLAPAGSHGDVHPLVGVGRALTARGHRVTLVTAEPFRPLAAANGFDAFHPTATTAEYDSLIHHPGLHDPSRAIRVLFGPPLFEQLLRREYAVLDALAKPGTVVVAGTLSLAARLVREVRGVPLATVHLQPLTLQSAVDVPAFPQWPGCRFVPAWAARLAYRYADRFVLDPLLAPPLNRLRAEVRLPPVRRVWGAWRHSPDRVIGLFPDWFASAPDWPPRTRLTGFVRYDQGETRDLPPGLDEFLSGGEPPVVATFGSAMRAGRAYIAAAAEACRRLGRRVLVLAAGGDQIPPLPAGAAHFDYAPFGRVFPRAAAVIHHGGIGTTAQALAAGVPQLVVPMANDQPDNAIRVCRLGVARRVAGRRFTAARAERALRALLADPAVPAACARVAAKMREGDPAGETCRLIEDL